MKSRTMPLRHKPALSYDEDLCVWRFRIQDYQLRDAYKAMDLAMGKLVRIRGRLVVYATADIEVARKMAKILQTNAELISA